MSRVKTVDEIRAAFPEDASILITGACPETIGSLPRELLSSAVGDDQGAVVITTKDAAEHVHRQFERASEFASTSKLAVVDATPKDRRHAEPDENVWKTSSPVDFGGAMLGLRRGYESLALEHDTIHLLFDSLTTPLLSADSMTVLRYAHQVMLEGGSRSGLQLFPVCTNVTGERDISKLKHLSERMIEVRKRGGERQVRLHGLREASDEWFTLPEHDTNAGVAGLV